MQIVDKFYKLSYTLIDDCIVYYVGGLKSEKNNFNR